MAETFSSKILGQISEVIKAEFTQAQVFFEELEPDTQKGAFGITLEEANMHGMNLAQHRRSNVFAVKYLPATSVAECCMVADKLFELLKYLTLPEYGRLLATEMEMKMTEGQLHFKVRYNYTLAYEAEQTQMAEVKTTQGGIYG